MIVFSFSAKGNTNLQFNSSIKKRNTKPQVKCQHAIKLSF